MATMNTQSFGLSGVASTDLGLGASLSDQMQQEIAKRKKKASQGMTNPIAGAGMALLGGGSPGSI